MQDIIKHIISTLNSVKLDQSVRAKMIISTSVKMNKKDVETKTIKNPYDSATKVSTIIVDINPQYEDVVNQQREAEEKSADFESQERKWGTNIGRGIVEKDGKLYLSYIPVQTVLNSYFVNNDLIEYSELKPFIPVKKPNEKQDLENEVKFRTVSMSNIIGFEIL